MSSCFPRSQKRDLGHPSWYNFKRSKTWLASQEQPCCVLNVLTFSHCAKGASRPRSTMHLTACHCPTAWHEFERRASRHPAAEPGDCPIDSASQLLQLKTSSLTPSQWVSPVDWRLSFPHRVSEAKTRHPQCSRPFWRSANSPERAILPHGLLYPPGGVFDNG